MGTLYVFLDVRLGNRFVGREVFPVLVIVEDELLLSQLVPHVVHDDHALALIGN